MATIQDLMKAHHHTKLKALLDKFQEAGKPVQHFAEGGDVSDDAPPITPEDILNITPKETADALASKNALSKVKEAEELDPENAPYKLGQTRSDIGKSIKAKSKAVEDIGTGESKIDPDELARRIKGREAVETLAPKQEQLDKLEALKNSPEMQRQAKIKADNEAVAKTKATDVTSDPGMASEAEMPVNESAHEALLNKFKAGQAAEDAAKMSSLNKSGVLADTSTPLEKIAQGITDAPYKADMALKNLPNKASNALNAIAESPITKNVGAGLSGLGAVASGVEGTKAANDLLTSNQGLPGKIAEGLHTLGHSVNAAAGMTGAAAVANPALAIPAAGAALVGTGVNLAGDTAQELQDIHNRSIDPKNVAAVKAAFEAPLPPAPSAPIAPTVGPGMQLQPPNQQPQANTPGITPEGKILGPYNPATAGPLVPPPSTEESTEETSTSENPIARTLAAFKAMQDDHAKNLTEAQQAANKNEFNANLAKAAMQFSSGATGMGSHGIVSPAKIDTSVLDSLLKTAKTPIDQYEQQVANEKHDPNSGYSMALKTALAPLMEKAGVSEEALSGMNGASLEKVAPWITKQVQAQDRQKYLELIQGTKKSAADEKAERSALQQTEGMLESARGNPVVAQAEKDIYAAQKANSLANLYGDPNKLSSQQVATLRNEIAKIAVGGVSSQHELNALDPKALQGQLAGVWSRFSNTPTPANAGAFIKQYQEYANTITKDAQKVIEDKYGRVIESRKKSLGEDNYNTLKHNYIDRFKNQETSSGGFPKTVSNGTHQAIVKNEQELKEATAEGFQ